MNIARIFRVAMLAIGLAAAAPAAMAEHARFTTIDYPGAVYTVALGINPGGDIAGGYYDESYNEHAFVLRHGKFTSFDYPGADWTEAEKISPQGDIVGQYGFYADGTTHGFLLRRGSFYPVELPNPPSDQGLPNTMPFGISPNGTIVGCYHQSDPNGNVIVETMHGFVMTAAGASLDPLARAMHTGVNPSGDITGNYSDPALGGAFRNSYIISHGAWRWFTYPGSKVTRSWDISATGDVAGWYKDSSGNYHGFLFHARDEGAQRDDDRSLRGTMTSIDVDLPGVLATYAYGINADGDIVGYYEDSAGLHGFLLSHREE